MYPLSVLLFLKHEFHFWNDISETAEQSQQTGYRSDGFSHSLGMGNFEPKITKKRLIIDELLQLLINYLK